MPCTGPGSTRSTRVLVVRRILGTGLSSHHRGDPIQGRSASTNGDIKSGYPGGFGTKVWCSARRRSPCEMAVVGKVTAWASVSAGLGPPRMNTMTTNTAHAPTPTTSRIGVGKGFTLRGCTAVTQNACSHPRPGTRGTNGDKVKFLAFEDDGNRGGEWEAIDVRINVGSTQVRGSLRPHRARCRLASRPLHARTVRRSRARRGPAPPGRGDASLRGQRHDDSRARRQGRAVGVVPHGTRRSSFHPHLDVVHPSAPKHLNLTQVPPSQRRHLDGNVGIGTRVAGLRAVAVRVG